jgi:uncharacterized protein YjiS (DUF1127 family)
MSFGSYRDHAPRGDAVMPERDDFMHRFWQGCTATIAWARRCRAERKARRELLGLSDVVLKDLGVDRSEVVSIVRYGRTDATRRTRLAAGQAAGLGQRSMGTMGGQSPTLISPTASNPFRS